MAMAMPADEYHLPDFQTTADVERFTELDRVLARADAEGVIAPLPEDKTDKRQEAVHPSRITTIRLRLFMLGYLRRKKGRGRINKTLVRAITTFQQEAGLSVDGWVGTQTWTALEELVGFEAPTNLQRWLTDFMPNPALRRAVRLRLHVLGLLRRRRTASDEEIQHALRDFTAVASSLGFTTSVLIPDYSFATISVLFDQDKMVDRLARAGDAFVYHRVARVPDKRTRKLVRKLVISVAKIELWLLGYELVLNGTARFPRPPGGRYDRHAYPLFHALRCFWQSCGERSEKAKLSALKISGRFFKQLEELAKEPDRSEDQAAAVAKAIEQAEPRHANKIWERIKEIGSRLWDGVKRAWRWLKKLLRWGQKALAWISNLARLAHHWALNAFVVVKDAAKRAASAIGLLREHRYPESDPAHLVIERDKDFDFRLFVQQSNDPAETARIVSHFRYHARQLRIGLRLLGDLLDILITAITRFAWASGWLGLIYALLKLCHHLKKYSSILSQKMSFDTTA